MIQKLTDNELKEKIEKILKMEDVRDIQKYNAKIRNEELKRLKEIRGIAFRASLADTCSYMARKHYWS